MFINPNLITALILGAALFIAGYRLAGRFTSRSSRFALFVLFMLLCLPAISFVGYYTHLLGEPLWYIQFRALPGSEILSATWGLLFGFLAGLRPQSRILRSGVIWCLLLIFVPFAKPIVLPAAFTPIQNQWQDGICLQTTSSTCGPASLATIFAHFGLRRTEADIARRAFTCRSGTENWYLIRYARRQGLQATVLVERDLSRLPTPAILGVRIGPYGHFITLLRNDAGIYTIGEPRFGRLELSAEEFHQRYSFNGFSISFSR